MSTASSSSDWLVVEEWDLLQLDCESISSCSESISNFSIVSSPRDAEPQIAASVTYLGALTNNMESGKVSGAASFLDSSLAEAKRFGKPLALSSIKTHMKPAPLMADVEAGFRLV